MSPHEHEEEHEHPSIPLESVNLAAEKPVHVFVIKSNMTSKSVIEKLMPDSLREAFYSEKTPQELRDKMSAMVEKMVRARGQVNNYISLMLTVDSAGIYRAYSTQGNEKVAEGKIERKRAPDTKGLCREMSTEDECMDEEMIRANMAANETMFELRQAAGDWNGDIELMKAFEGENALQEARGAIGGEMFDVLYPATPATASPIQVEDVEKAKPLSAAKRAALVEKFGESAIASLEEKMHGKSKGI